MQSTFTTWRGNEGEQLGQDSVVPISTAQEGRVTPIQAVGSPL